MCWGDATHRIIILTNSLTSDCKISVGGRIVVQRETKPGNASPVKTLTEVLEKFQTMDGLPRFSARLPQQQPCITSEQYQSVMFSPGPIKNWQFLGGVEPELLEKAQNPQGVPCTSPSLCNARRIPTRRILQRYCHFPRPLIFHDWQSIFSFHDALMRWSRQSDP